MRVILGPVPCHDCAAPVIWVRHEDWFGWRDAKGPNIPHHCQQSRDRYIASKLLAGERQVAIAKELGLTKQRINQIAQRLRGPSRQRSKVA